MAVLQGRTRAQLATSVLHNLSVVEEITAKGAGTTTTFKIEKGLAGSDEFKGYFLKYLTGANTTGHGVVTASSVPAAGIVTLTFSPAAISTTDGDTALLIGKDGEGLNPQRIYQFLNDAITEVTGYFFDPVESVAFHVDERDTHRFVLPTTMTMVERVYYRNSFTKALVHNCDSDWDEQTVLASVTRSVDTQDYKQGGGAIRFVFAAGAATGVVSSKAITALDLRKYTHIECWVKCTIATASGDFRILLDDTASVASALENLLIPALAADTWTFVRLALGNPELDSAIISVGLRHQVDVGAATFWIDDVNAVIDDSAKWTLFDWRAWSIDPEARALVLARSPGYKLLKIVGGDKPVLLTADGTVTEVPEAYLIAEATGLALLSGVGGSSMDAAQRSNMGNAWIARAERERLALTQMSGVVLVE